MVTTIYPELARHLSSIGLGGVSHLVYKKGGGGVGRTIQQSNTTFLLKVDNSSIGYDLESDDEIIAIGKFNS